jgi:transposase
MIDKLDGQIAKLIENDDDWRGKSQQLQSATGVGPVVASTLIAGKRRCFGGRASVRKVLFMAALTATHHNPVIAALHRRLTAAGKPFKLVMTACMRKLLVILNALLKTGQSWQPPIATNP